MKKLLLVLSMIFASIYLFGCDAGNEIVDVTLISYPSRIVYVAGVDKQLDLSGGMIRLKLRDGRELERTMDYLFCLMDIDFNRPGIYTVSIANWIQFPIQVVDKNYITGIMNDK